MGMYKRVENEQKGLDPEENWDTVVTENAQN